MKKRKVFCLLVLLLLLPITMCIYAGCNKKIITYGVTFVAGEGVTGTVPVMDRKAKGDTFDIPGQGNLSKTGYAFLGWDDGSKVYKEAEKYTMGDSGVTFTSAWTKLLRINISGGYIWVNGVPKNTTQLVLPNSEVSVSAADAPAGKMFKGWMVEDEYVSTASTYTFTATSDIRLVAIYVDYHTVTVGGGRVYLATDLERETNLLDEDGKFKAEQNVQYTIVANPAPEHKYFYGWTTSAIESGKVPSSYYVDEEGDRVGATFMSAFTSDSEYYAYYEEDALSAVELVTPTGWTGKYYVGDEISLEGLTLNATYMSGLVVRNIPVTEDMISGLSTNSASEGELQATITYENNYEESATTTLTYSVYPKLSSETLTKSGTLETTEYLTGTTIDDIDLYDLTFSASFLNSKNGTPNSFDVTSDVTISFAEDTDTSTTGTKTVIVTYTYNAIESRPVTATVEVEVTYVNQVTMAAPTNLRIALEGDEHVLYWENGDKNAEAASYDVYVSSNTQGVLDGYTKLNEQPITDTHFTIENFNSDASYIVVAHATDLEKYKEESKAAELTVSSSDADITNEITALFGSLSSYTGDWTISTGPVDTEEYNNILFTATYNSTGDVISSVLNGVLEEGLTHIGTWIIINDKIYAVGSDGYEEYTLVTDNQFALNRFSFIKSLSVGRNTNSIDSYVGEETQISLTAKYTYRDLTVYSFEFDNEDGDRVSMSIKAQGDKIVAIEYEGVTTTIDYTSETEVEEINLTKGYIKTKTLGKVNFLTRTITVEAGTLVSGYNQEIKPTSTSTTAAGTTERVYNVIDGDTYTITADDVSPLSIESWGTSIYGEYNASKNVEYRPAAYTLSYDLGENVQLYVLGDGGEPQELNNPVSYTAPITVYLVYVGDLGDEDVLEWYVNDTKTTLSTVGNNGMTIYVAALSPTSYEFRAEIKAVTYKYNVSISGGYMTYYDIENDCQTDENGNPKELGMSWLPTSFENVDSSSYLYFWPNVPKNKDFDYWEITIGGNTVAENDSRIHLYRDWGNSGVVVQFRTSETVKVTAHFKDHSDEPEEYTVTVPEGYGIIVDGEKRGTSVKVQEGTQISFSYKSGCPENEVGKRYALDYNGSTYYDQSTSLNVYNNMNFKEVYVDDDVDMEHSYLYKTDYKTIYAVGESFDPTNMRIHIAYSQGSSRNVDVTGDMVTNFDTNNGDVNGWAYIEYNFTQIASFEYSVRYSYEIRVESGLELYYYDYEHGKVGTKLSGDIDEKDNNYYLYTHTTDQPLFSATYFTIYPNPESIYLTDLAGYDTGSNIYYSFGSYFQLHDSYTIDKVTSDVNRIEQNGSYQNNYLVGDTANYDSMHIIVIYNTPDHDYNNLHKILTVTKDMISSETPFEGSVLGDNKVLTVTYGGASVDFGYNVVEPMTITVANDLVAAIEIHANGTTYSGQSSYELPANTDYSIYYTGAQEIGQYAYNVYVNSSETADTYAISYDSNNPTVYQLSKSVTINGIYWENDQYDNNYDNTWHDNAGEIIAGEIKHTYEVGEQLDLSKVQFRIHYLHSLPRDIDYTQFTVEGFDSSTATENGSARSIYINYGEDRIYRIDYSVIDYIFVTLEEGLVIENKTPDHDNVYKIEKNGAFTVRYTNGNTPNGLKDKNNNYYRADNVHVSDSDISLYVLPMEDKDISYVNVEYASDDDIPTFAQGSTDLRNGNDTRFNIGKNNGNNYTISISDILDGKVDGADYSGLDVDTLGTYKHFFVAYKGYVVEVSYHVIATYDITLGEGLSYQDGNDTFQVTSDNPYQTIRIDQAYLDNLFSNRQVGYVYKLGFSDTNIGGIDIYDSTYEYAMTLDHTGTIQVKAVFSGISSIDAQLRNNVYVFVDDSAETVLSNYVYNVRYNNDEECSGLSYAELAQNGTLNITDYDNTAGGKTFEVKYSAPGLQAEIVSFSMYVNFNEYFILNVPTYISAEYNGVAYEYNNNKILYSSYLPFYIYRTDSAKDIVTTAPTGRYVALAYPSSSGTSYIAATDLNQTSEYSKQYIELYVSNAGAVVTLSIDTFDDTVSDFTINKNKEYYEVGEDFETSDITLNVYYTHGVNNPVTVTSGFTCSSLDTSSSGNRSAYINYADLSREYDYNVKYVLSVTVPNTYNVYSDSEHNNQLTGTPNGNDNIYSIVGMEDGSCSYNYVYVSMADESNRPLDLVAWQVTSPNASNRYCGYEEAMEVANGDTISPATVEYQSAALYDYNDYDDTYVVGGSLSVTGKTVMITYYCSGYHYRYVDVTSEMIPDFSAGSAGQQEVYVYFDPNDNSHYAVYRYNVTATTYTVTVNDDDGNTYFTYQNGDVVSNLSALAEGATIVVHNNNANNLGFATCYYLDDDSTGTRYYEEDTITVNGNMSFTYGTETDTYDSNCTSSISSGEISHTRIGLNDSFVDFTGVSVQMNFAHSIHTVDMSSFTNENWLDFTLDGFDTNTLTTSDGRTATIYYNGYEVIHFTYYVGYTMTLGTSLAPFTFENDGRLYQEDGTTYQVYAPYTGDADYDENYPNNTSVTLSYQGYAEYLATALGIDNLSYYSQYMITDSTYGDSFPYTYDEYTPKYYFSISFSSERTSRALALNLERTVSECTLPQVMSYSGDLGDQEISFVIVADPNDSAADVTSDENSQYTVVSGHSYILYTTENMTVYTDNQEVGLYYNLYLTGNDGAVTLGNLTWNNNRYEVTFTISQDISTIRMSKTEAQTAYTVTVPTGYELQVSNGYVYDSAYRVVAGTYNVIVPDTAIEALLTDRGDTLDAFSEYTITLYDNSDNVLGAVEYSNEQYVVYNIAISGDVTLDHIAISYTPSYTSTLDSNYNWTVNNGDVNVDNSQFQVERNTNVTVTLSDGVSALSGYDVTSGDIGSYSIYLEDDLGGKYYINTSNYSFNLGAIQSSRTYTLNVYRICALTLPDVSEVNGASYTVVDVNGRDDTVTAGDNSYTYQVLANRPITITLYGAMDVIQLVENSVNSNNYSNYAFSLYMNDSLFANLAYENNTLTTGSSIYISGDTTLTLHVEENVVNYTVTLPDGTDNTHWETTYDNGGDAVDYTGTQFEVSTGTSITMRYISDNLVYLQTLAGDTRDPKDFATDLQNGAYVLSLYDNGNKIGDFDNTYSITFTVSSNMALSITVTTAHSINLQYGDFGIYTVLDASSETMYAYNAGSSAGTYQFNGSSISVGEGSSIRVFYTGGDTYLGQLGLSAAALKTDGSSLLALVDDPSNPQTIYAIFKYAEVDGNDVFYASFSNVSSDITAYLHKYEKTDFYTIKLPSGYTLQVVGEIENGITGVYKDYAEDTTTVYVRSGSTVVISPYLLDEDVMMAEFNDLINEMGEEMGTSKWMAFYDGTKYYPIDPKDFTVTINNVSSNMTLTIEVVETEI